MKLKEFFIGRAIVFVLLIIIGLGIFIYKDYFFPTKNTEVPEPLIQENTENVKSPVFTWEYQYDDTLNLDGYPNTNIYLEAKYPNGKVERKFIDTTNGSCNALPDSDPDSLPGSENIQCYYAGLGYRFKITKGENSYLIKRKTFEEGSPDYAPPTFEYEVISEFLLTNQ